ncbi:MAG: phosphoglycolate phosphatase [Comamonadaceae bacterium]|nr:phosphoglycolate phosphatase [Comamonadaceae bacterium]
MKFHPVAGIRAVLFDLDGTLIDSAPDLGAAADLMRTRRGLPSLPVERYRPFAGSGARGMLRVALERAPGDADYEDLKVEFLALYESCMFERTRPFPEAAELLDALVEKGLRWGVVTNKAERFAKPLTASMAMFAGAGAIVGGDTTPFSKPHPEPLLEAARRLSLQPHQCMYVGDDERDILAGKAAGMHTVAAMYGYLGDGLAVSAWGAHAEVHNPLEVLKLIALP